ncbi:MAG: hypothetical protein PVSMB8_12470 [Vulcanimicrobiaceae bacterium]
MAKKRETAKKLADLRTAEVEETSAALDTELRKSEGLPPRRSPTDWRGPNSAPTELTPIDPAFERITELIVIDNPLEVYRHLEKELKIGEKRSDMGTVRRALDEAESNAREAHRLWMTALIERERFELTNKVIFAGMRTQALAVMQQEKKHGERSKQISEADIEATCAAMFPDQWRDQELRRTRYKAMEKSMENLNDRWSSRCYTLSALHAKQRGS